MMNIQKCLETLICGAAKHLKDNGYDKFMLETLVNNLKVVTNNDIELTDPVQDILKEIAVCICKSTVKYEDVDEKSFLDIVNMLTLILNCTRNNRIMIIESVFMVITSDVKRILNLPLSDISNNSSSLIRKLRLMEMFLSSVAEKETDIRLDMTIFTPLKEIIIQALLSGEHSVTTYALTLLNLHQKLSQCSFILQVWLHISVKVIADNTFVESFLIILTHILNFNVQSEVKLGIISTFEFWSILKRCFENFGNIRKYAIRILKYILSYISTSQFSITHGVWNCDSPNQYDHWWKMYFIIIESLDEKQSHLVLPVFGMIQDLLNSNIPVDIFWILNAIQYAMIHDSRTVRIQACQCLFNIKTVQFENSYLPSLIKILLQTTNDSVFFRKIFKMEYYETFKNQFINWLAEFSSQNNGSFFTENLLHIFTELKWSPIPLYYILALFTESIIHQSKLIYNGKVKNFISDVTRFHNIPIRAAVQSLFIKLLCTTCERNLETVLLFLETLCYFNENESLERGTPMWIHVVEYLKQSTDFKSVETLMFTRIKNHVNCNQRSSSRPISALARDLILIHDAFELLEKSSLIQGYFLEMMSTFSLVCRKPYLNTKVEDNCLKLLLCMSSIVNQPRKIQRSTPITIIIKLHHQCTDIFMYIIDRIIKSSENFELVEFYASCLSEFSDSVNFIDNKGLYCLLNNQLSRLGSSFPERENSSIYSFSLIILWIYRTVTSHKKIMNPENIQKIVATMFVNYVRTNAEKSFLLNNDLKNDIHNINTIVKSNFSNVFWKLFAIFSKLQQHKLNEYFETKIIFDLIFQFLDLGREENMIEMFRALRYILRNCVFLENEDVLIRIMDESWKRLEEIQANSYYSTLLSYWIKAFFQKSFFELLMCYSKICYYISVLVKVVEKEGRQSCHNVILVLKHLEEIDELFCMRPEIVNILVNAFCVAHICREDQRIEYETIVHISSKQNYIFSDRISEFNFLYSWEEMRLRVLDLLLKSIQKGKNSINSCQIIIELLTLNDGNNNKRYFNDSVFHRTKTRKLQLLLIFESVLYHNCVSSNLFLVQNYEKIYNFIVRSLLIEPHQPSVRYMLEWLLMRVVIHCPSDFEEKFWNSFSEASEERIGSICSFISIAFHLANVFKTKQFIDKAIKLTLPWTMAQHFNARLYAQTVLVKLIHLNEETKHEYKMFEKSLNSCLKYGNAVKNSLKLMEDFYFTHFHPVDHFSLQVILWDLPRLSCFSRDELIPVSLCKRFLCTKIEYIPISDASDSFSIFNQSSWIAKASATSYFFEKGKPPEKENERISNYNESQKKFIPLQYDTHNLIANENLLKRSHLIVVASLIDRAPNLGGLTRTSEVFGVSALVFDNLDIIRNKEFISLSITAEKHIPLLEVKQYDLFNYLKRMKEDLYCIIGAEQVTNSRRLGDFLFPLKSVVVLGNEKRGIPADLLPVLDVCVEIPQIGFIRSLNVHVSASLIIWEYAKQHLLIK